MDRLHSSSAGAAKPRTAVPPPKTVDHPEMVWVQGRIFRMGSNSHYPEEAPVHRVKVDGFWMDRTPVTNGDFRNFVEATGYVSFAEIAGVVTLFTLVCAAEAFSIPKSASFDKNSVQPES